jgi:uncharacterized protein (DUF2345 family)
MHDFSGGGQSKPAVLNDLPTGSVGQLDNWLDLGLYGWNAQPLAGVRYVLTLADGSVRRGTLDDQGYAHQPNVPPGGPHRVDYENPPLSEDPPPFTLDELADAIKTYVGA